MKILFGQIIFVRKYYIALYTWHDHWAEVWVKEMKYRSWRIYLIFRALANNTQNPIKARQGLKHSKVFVKPYFIMNY